jgi:virulence-associated protein VapD
MGQRLETIFRFTGQVRYSSLLRSSQIRSVAHPQPLVNYNSHLYVGKAAEAWCWSLTPSGAEVRNENMTLHLRSPTCLRGVEFNKIQGKLYLKFGHPSVFNKVQGKLYLKVGHPSVFNKLQGKLYLKSGHPSVFNKVQGKLYLRLDIPVCFKFSNTL